MSKIPMDADILPPSNDHIFKTILTHPSAEPVRKDVVSAAINRPVVSIRVLNNELPVADDEEKRERLDVNCTIDGGDQVDVEMQSVRMEEVLEGYVNFFNKYIYYLTDLHSSQKSAGVKYYDLVRTYQVTFSGYTVLPDRPDFVNRISLRFPDGDQLSDQINMVIIELSKLDAVLKKPVEEMTSLEMWAVFFRYVQDVNHRELINRIISVKKEIAMAAELLMSISKDQEERARFMSRKKFETDLTSNLLTAEARGEARGEIRGRLAVAAKMKEEGIEMSVIMKVTGLSLKEVLNA